MRDISTPQKPNSFNLPSVNLPALHRVNSRRIDVGVTEDIGKSDNILVHFIICTRKQMTQVVRKNLLLRHSRRFANAPETLSYLLSSYIFLSIPFLTVYHLNGKTHRPKTMRFSFLPI
jgi:hypothetical protein